MLAHFSAPGPTWIFSRCEDNICYSPSLPASSTYRGTGIFLFSCTHKLHFLFFSQAKKTTIWVVHCHSVRKYFTTVFTNPFSTLSSQYSLFYAVYLLNELYALALQLWRSAFHLTALVPALKVIHSFLDDFPNFLCLDNASQHHGISKF